MHKLFKLPIYEQFVISQFHNFTVKSELPDSLYRTGCGFISIIFEPGLCPMDDTAAASGTIPRGGAKIVARKKFTVCGEQDN